MARQKKLQELTIWCGRGHYLSIFMEDFNWEHPTKESKDAWAQYHYGVDYEYISNDEVALVESGKEYPRLEYTLEQDVRRGIEKGFISPFKLTPEDRMEYPKKLLNYMQKEKLYNFRFSDRTLFGKKAYMYPAKYNEPVYKEERDPKRYRLSPFKAQWEKGVDYAGDIDYFIRSKHAEKGFVVNLVDKDTYNGGGVLLGTEVWNSAREGRYQIGKTTLKREYEYAQDIITDYVLRLLEEEVFGKSDIPNRLRLDTMVYDDFLKRMTCDYSYGCHIHKYAATRLITDLEYGFKVDKQKLFINGADVSDRKKMIATAIMTYQFYHKYSIQNEVHTYEEFRKKYPDYEVLNTPHTFEF